MTVPRYIVRLPSAVDLTLANLTLDPATKDRWLPTERAPAVPSREPAMSKIRCNYHPETVISDSPSTLSTDIPGLACGPNEVVLRPGCLA